jgi:hypothetical protein
VVFGSGSAELGSANTVTAEVLALHPVRNLGPLVEVGL